MKKAYLFLIFILFFFSNSYSQLGKRTYIPFIGLHPEANFSKDYPSGSFDLNILPFVFQCPFIGYNMDFRFLSIMDYGIRPDNSAIKNLGFELLFPFHFISTRIFPYITEGFYISPGYLYKRDIIEKHHINSVFFELGYNFHFGKRFSIMTGLQYGRKFIKSSSGSNLVENHYGIKFILGFWLVE